METSSLFGYAAALVAVTAAPGPLVAVIVTRSLGRDVSGAASFAAGVCIGDIIAILAIALGIGTWAQGSPEWLAVLKAGGVAYLLWLALQIWRDSNPARAPSGGAAPRRGRLASTGAGIALCLGNPATFVFYLLLLPTVAPAGLSGPATLATVLLVSLAAVGAALGGIILLAAQLQRILVTPASATAFGRLMAAMLVATSLSLLMA